MWPHDIHCDRLLYTSLLYLTYRNLLFWTVPEPEKRAPTVDLISPEEIACVSWKGVTVDKLKQCGYSRRELAKLKSARKNVLRQTQRAFEDVFRRHKLVKKALLRRRRHQCPREAI